MTPALISTRSVMVGSAAILPAIIQAISFEAMQAISEFH
jgi:hypothetical protein